MRKRKFKKKGGIVVPEGLVAYYTFDGNADDSSDSGNNGTIDGTTLTTGYDGKVNGAYSFDGIDNMITLDSPIAIVGTEWTYTFWASFNNAGYNPIGSTSVTSSSYIMTYYNGLVYLRPSTNVLQYIRTTQTLTLGVYYFFAVRRNGDGNNFNIIINNINKALIYNTTITNNDYQPQVLGAGRTDGYLNGNLDEFRAYNRALTDEEITKIYNH